MHGTLFALLVLQMILAFIGFEVPVIGFFHPVNALLIFGLAGLVAWRGVAAAQEAAAGSAPRPSHTLVTRERSRARRRRRTAS